MENSDILLITPPFSQLNTPYPATVFLKGFLNEHKYKVKQLDLSIETILTIFSKEGLDEIFNIIASKKDMLQAHHAKMLKSREKYCSLIEGVISFLQGNDSSYAKLICNGALPKGERFKAAESLIGLFKKSDIITKAKFLATLFIEDLGDLISVCIDNNFGFSRYAEQIGISPRLFSLVEPKINKETFITKIMCSLIEKAVRQHEPKTIGFTIPFPGNLLSALIMSRYLKKHYTQIPIVIGGGWVNTELRQLTNPKIFDYVDYICLDFGERPILQLLRFLINNESKHNLVRTYARENGKIVFINNKMFPDFEPENTGTPDYSNLHLNEYISSVETANPMSGLWTDGRWNKLMIAQGCYWHKCAFCDISLDYISKYHSLPAHILCDRIEAIIKQTFTNCFHFTDEAAPPNALKELALELIKRNIKIVWWTNIRFESAFNYELCKLLSRSGCIAVSGGLEVLSDRLLKLMNKGVTIEQAIQTAHNFSSSGIMVHAYLMYGFPTQSAQETIDSLEIVRQLFKSKLIHSAYWHRFAMTVHSPIGMNPKGYGVEAINSNWGSFANNGLPHLDKKGCEHDRFGFGLKKALYNYLHKSCLDSPIKEWFAFKVPRTAIPPGMVEKIMKNNRLSG